MRRRWICILVALLLFDTISCVTNTRPAFVPGLERGLNWPAAPARPRLTWVGEYGTQKRGYARPHGVGIAANGSVCVVDTGARRVWLHRAEKAARVLGRGELLSPVDCGFLPGGKVVVADSSAARLIAFDSRGRMLWSTPPGEYGRPTGVAVDGKSQRIVVCDAIRHELVFVDYQGRVLSRCGGRGTAPGKFNFPTAVAIGPKGLIHVIDSLNFRIQILRPDGKHLMSFGIAGDGPGTFQRPRGLGVDRNGQIYVADAIFDNVQVFSAQGRLLMALGIQGHGPGQFWMPAGVAVGENDRLLVADAYNHRVQVFRILSLISEDDQ